MLIEFTVGNFRSFREPITLSMEAASITSEDKSVDTNNLIPVNQNLKLLSSAAVYGANASGKSNLISAFSFMRKFVMDSVRETQAEEPILVNPFRLSSAMETKPSFFEIVFLIENQRYRYGFEVTREKIEREWLYYTPTIREARLFTREGEQITRNPRSFREGSGLEARTRANALFLSVVAQFNGPIAQKVVNWFRNVRFISGLNDTGYRDFTLSQYQEDPQRREQILALVRSLDVGIEGVMVEKVEPDKVNFPKGMPDELKKLLITSPGNFISAQSIHTQFDEEGQPVGQVEFDFERDESAGTQKLFYLAGPILDVLSAGRTLIVDEMEARMHPLITCAIIRLFNSLETNPKRAQLIFTTHDTNLLDRTLFRRDQIWFVEKDSFGASHLYSLVEFKPRNDEPFERNYLRGKYGAIPYLGDISRIVSEGTNAMAEDSSHAA